MEDKDYSFTDENGNECNVGSENKEENTEKKDDVHIGFDGIHVHSKNGDTVDIGKGGVHVHSGSGDNVDVDGQKATVNGKDYDYKNEAKKRTHDAFPFFALATLAYVVMVIVSAIGAYDFGGRNVYLWGLLIFLIVPFADTICECVRKKRLTSGLIFLIITIAFFVLGFGFSAWHPAWMLFLFVPLIDSIGKAFSKHNANEFAFWDVALIAFLSLGFAPTLGIAAEPLWHPGWVVFLLIPVYYAFVNYFKKK